MNCHFVKYNLHFRKPGGTSRGVLHNKETYIIILTNGEKTAYGECNLFKNLSFDDRNGYEQKLSSVCEKLSQEVLFYPEEELSEWPSILFGVETVLNDWKNGGRQIIFSEIASKNDFTIPTNALIWMGTKEEMKQQIIAKLKDGFTSIKLKIGAIDFESELELLKFIRKQFSVNEVEIRLDANGAFTFGEAREKIKRLSAFDINYLEQPIKAGQWHEMAELCNQSPIKIALDEELIGVIKPGEKRDLLDTISPQLLILKPALIGGFAATTEWKNLIEKSGGEWVITSALESNIGLNAIAQYTSLLHPKMAQGLGTGQLFTNNFPSPYTIDSKGLHYDQHRKWDLSLLQ